MGGQTAWERERPALERLGERMHEGWEWMRVSWPRGRTVTGQGEGGRDPGEEALAQGQREGQSGGRPAQAREHVLGGPRGRLSGINHLVRQSSWWWRWRWCYLYISWDSGAPSTMVMDDDWCHCVLSGGSILLLLSFHLTAGLCSHDGLARTGDRHHQSVLWCPSEN